MGYAAAGACYPTTDEALAAWCSNVEPGSNASSCSSCNSANSTCSVSYLSTSSNTVQTISVPVYTPSCTVPDPVGDATTYTSAIIALWVAVWAAKQAYNLFRNPHANAD